MWSVLISVFCMLATIWVLDFFVLPKKETDRVRNHAITLLWISPPSMLFFSLLMLTYRPIFSSFITVATYATIVVFNNAKVKALKEPLVYSDFSLFQEIIRHPHLYIKYIGLHNLVLVGIAAVAACIGGFGFETPFINRIQIEDYFPTLFFFVSVVGTMYLIMYGPLRKPFKKILIGLGPDADVSKNVSELGLVVCLIFYFFLSGTDKIKTEKKSRKTKKQDLDHQKTSAQMPLFHVNSEKSKGKLPNIVAIQAESFFDVRYLEAAIDTDILNGYDKIVSEATYYGRLDVPAWGAYTMRTEFAFLSGLPEAALGHHRYNPYLQLGRQPFWTLAHTLKSLGYETVCVHPFPSTFFNRKKVFPNLGFDHFVDMSAFKKEDQFGPYISDVALGDKITELLDAAESPLFVFAITMENHGAWDKDRLKDDDLDSMNAEKWPLGSHSLSHYISHMRNTDQMMTNIRDYLQAQETPGMMCLYGDHMPNLKDAFSKTGYEDPRTDYFIWHSSGKRHRRLSTRDRKSVV